MFWVSCVHSGSALFIYSHMRQIPSSHFLTMFCSLANLHSSGSRVALSLYFFVSLSLSNCIFVQKCSSHDVEECKAFEFKTVYVKKDGMQACRVFLLSKGEMQEG